MSYFKCKDVSRIASEAQDRKLGLVEIIGMKIHLWICKPCVHYVEHLKFLQKVSTQAEVSLPEKSSLSDEARQRIKENLKK